jgi:phosphoglycolate phosphatase
MRTILFDLDGTLMLTGGAGERGMNRAGRDVFGDHFTIDGVMIAGGMDPVIYRQAAERCGIVDHASKHDSFRDRYLQTLAEELRADPQRAQCLPGVTDLLGHLDQSNDVWLGLVTGNYRQAAPLKLRAGGIDPDRFRVCAFGDEAPTRPDMVTLAVARHAGLVGHTAKPGSFLVVGDTPRDIECAHANGIACLAVATGLYSETDLRAAGADAVVPDLTDPSPLWDFVGN